MNKIFYPNNRDLLYKEFYKIFSEGRIEKIDLHLNKIDYKEDVLSLKTLLVLPIEELIQIKDSLEDYSISKNISVVDANGKTVISNEFNDLFDYKGLQPKLASFFMNSSRINLQACHYCSIDFVNAFVDFPDYKNGLDFANSAEKDELMYTNGIDDMIADSLINNRPYTSYDELPVTPEVLEEISSIPFSNAHNHFTLDHLIPQGEYPYFSLCLYNLVPSCYSCNSKFKNDKEFIQDNDLPIISPTSNNYKLNDRFFFKVFFSKKFEDLNSALDFELRKEIVEPNAQIQNYLKIFKIMGRYAAHKSQILDLIQKKQKYPDSKIQELSNLTGLSRLSIEKMVFGEELYESKFNGKPFIKFKRDIAKNIKILRVI